LIAGKVYFPLAIPGAAVGILGNVIGSKLVIDKGNKLIKPVFVLALLLLMGRVVFNILNR